MPSSLRSRSPGVRSDFEGEVAKATQDVERPTSTVKFAEMLEVADIPSRSRSSLGPSRMSLMDEHGKPSRTSVTTGTTGTEGMVFGRDAVVEREKINEEARNTFAVMDLRYRDMVQDLIDLDNAFELGLADGNRQDFEKRIQSMRIIKTPPTSNGDKGKVELAVKKSDNKTQQTDKLSKEVTDGIKEPDHSRADKRVEEDVEDNKDKTVEKVDADEGKDLTDKEPAVVSGETKDQSKIEIVVTEATEINEERDQ